MSTVAIRVQGLGKHYRLGHQKPYDTLRDALTSIARTRLASLRQATGAVEPGQSTKEAIWALRDVSFSVEQGEVVGIIGRNGAGKSTLLKVLSRITLPTEGEVDIRGRVKSLLEVGTGFHHELTGLENIYLSGAILGMRKKEIDRKLDEIVAFAEVDRFIDTPVKRYSSGMQVRLAFAVAAHLEPEVLLVDEVLAVGDARFQRKCLAKMEDVGQHGRTVLFVSHNTAAITRLCPRAVLLDEGRVVQDGPSHEVVGVYLRSDLGTRAAREWPDPDTAPGDEVVRLCAVRVRGADGEISDALDIRHPIRIEMEYEVLRPGEVLVPNLHFTNEEGVYVFVAADFHDPEWRGRRRQPGRYVSTATIPQNFLAEGGILVGAAITSFNPDTVHLYEREAVAFHVLDSLEGDAARGEFAGQMPGVVRPLLPWTTELVREGGPS